MVLSFTRYLNGLIFFFYYIAEEQNLPANLEANNIENLRGDISMGSAAELSIWNPVCNFLKIYFKKNFRKILKTNFQKLN